MEQVEPYKVEHVEPYKVEHVEPYKVEHVEPYKVEHVEPSNVEHIEPSNVAQVEPSNVGHIEPSNVGHIEPSNVAQVEPSNVGHIEPSNVAQVEPSNVGHIEPSNVAQVEPSNVGHIEPSNVAQVEPSNVGHIEPSNVGHIEPSNVAQVEPSNVGHIEPSNVAQVEPSNVGHIEPSNVAQVEPPNVVHIEPHNVEQDEPPNIEPPYHTILMKNEIFCRIMKELEVWEQIKVRRVCLAWQDKIEDLFNEEPKRLLKLCVKEPPVDDLDFDRPWEPTSHIRQLQFEFVYNEPEIDSSKQVQISMSDRAFNTEAAQALGRFFPKIHALVINWVTDDNEQQIDNLVVLLSQVCSGLTSFGLIFSGIIRNEATLPKICAALNTHGGPLEQLHLMLPSLRERTLPNEHHEVFSVIYPAVELEKATGLVTNFSLSGECTNSNSILTKLAAKSSTPLDSLSLNPKMASLAIKTLKDKFSPVKRLQLSYITALEDVQPLVEYFPNVEQLHLTFQAERGEKFGFNWIRALKPLTKLTELTLVNFHLDYLSWHIALGNVAHFESLNQLRTLTVATADLFYEFRLSNLDIFYPGLKARHLAHTIGSQFPGLRELNLWSGDSCLRQTDNQTWQTVEQNINAELPTLLPLMPGLRVNVQLCHPVMHSEYLSEPDEYRQFFIDNLASFDSYRVGACNVLIRRYESEHDRDYLIRILNGNFGEEDRDVIRRLQDMALLCHGWLRFAGERNTR